MILYDNLGFNMPIALDLPFREGIGELTHDVAKPHHPIQMMNTPSWVSLVTGLMTMGFNGTNEYLRATNADTVDMNFMAGDYSLGGWIYWASGGEDSQIVMGRYSVSHSGWELYLYATGILTLRHHHAAGATQRTAIYSEDWTQDAWHMFGITRTGATAQHYRDGLPIDSIGDALIDPETAVGWFVIGTRCTLDTNYFKGQMWRPRVWPRALLAQEWLTIYEREKVWFGL